MYILFYLLLNVVHFLYNLFYLVNQQYVSLVKLYRSYKNSSSSQLQAANSSTNEALKIPKHIAILLGHEEPCVSDLLKLISWCILAGIPHITLYDHKGDLKKISSIAALSSDLSNGKKNGCHSKIKSIIESSLPAATAAAVIDHVRIQILSYSDGKEAMASLARDIGNSIVQNSMQSTDVNCELIKEKLSSNVPDPDLAIIFGKAMCSYGFLPWQTRITEFFLMPSHHGILHREFMDTLIKFSKCEQHFGK